MSNYPTSRLLVLTMIIVSTMLCRASNREESQSEVLNSPSLSMTAPNVTLSKKEKNLILVEVFEQSGKPGVWPDELGEPDQRFTITQFALFGLPQKYGILGERLSYKGPFVLRLSSWVSLPTGTHNLLIRTGSPSRVWLDKHLVREIDGVKMSSDAHGHMRPIATLELPYPKPRLGTEDTRIKVSSSGQDQLLTIESVIGTKRGSTPVYEQLICIQESQTSEWFVLSPKPDARLPFTMEALAQSRETQKQEFNTQETQARREALKNVHRYWNQRHKTARKTIQALEPIHSPYDGIDLSTPTVIDQLLHAKIASHNLRTHDDPKDALFQEGVWPILQDHCIRCHGTKAKGGLKLDSLGAALAGGKSDYATIVPGDPDKSELIFRVSADDEEDRMPPKGDGLSQSEVNLLSQWIQEGAKWTSGSDSIKTPELLSEFAFLRRIYMDTVGVPPTIQEINTYTKDSRKTKKSRLIDRLLNDPRNADHWVSYWQDVLAENPSLMKPTLNHSGPFRYWIHDSLLDNKPFDQFVTELITFQGDVQAGGAGGFKLATDNDSPMAAKAHIIGTAFLGIEMKCARCHDSPYHSTTQEDLFSIAAMLGGRPLEIPTSSAVPPGFFKKLDGRKSLIMVSLDPGTPIRPRWPFEDFIDGPPPVRDEFNSSAMELAWQLTRPENTRFSQVIVNRVWKRYFGQGFVEPAHDWEGNEPSHPELLDYLARDFVANGYDLRRLSRLILNTETYARSPIFEKAHSPADRFFEAPLRRRMSAEQLVDSLFHTAGVPLFTEELTLDLEGHWNESTFENYGFPERAWEFVSTSTERERASLSLPLVNEIVALMRVYGWRPNRAEPITERNTDPNVSQSGFLANSSLGLWLTNLSDYSEITAMAHDAESAEELINTLFLRLLTRLPNAAEKAEFVALLSPGFETRKTMESFQSTDWIPEVREVTWGNHLSIEANYYVSAKEARLLNGPAPTTSLNPSWRERMEDSLWVLINSPEFQYIQ